MDSIPIVRLTLDHMKHTIVHAMTEYTVKLDGTIKAAIESAVDNFDYEREIGALAEGILRDGIRQAIKAAVNQAIVYNDDFQKEIEKAVRAQLPKRKDA
jgi:hypothetical protein